MLLHDAQFGALRFQARGSGKPRQRVGLRNSRACAIDGAGGLGRVQHLDDEDVQEARRNRAGVAGGFAVQHGQVIGFGQLQAGDAGFDPGCDSRVIALRTAGLLPSGLFLATQPDNNRQGQFFGRLLAVELRRRRGVVVRGCVRERRRRCFFFF
ncbi:hypothetical protein [Achromobacter marplatensis]|uniref:hypothetical protein n=1 Tax=Achromobacter marplatensis TaxID=470868 RepID=UPI0002780DA4|nr:hypothetical protein [Achromobacter marplatensis]EJO31724.1 hypothetical protein QWC_10149 [Achromobacter marplatensis]